MYYVHLFTPIFFLPRFRHVLLIQNCIPQPACSNLVNSMPHPNLQCSPYPPIPIPDQQYHLHVFPCICSISVRHNASENHCSYYSIFHIYIVFNFLFLFKFLTWVQFTLLRRSLISFYFCLRKFFQRDFIDSIYW